MPIACDVHITQLGGPLISDRHLTEQAVLKGCVGKQLSCWSVLKQDSQLQPGPGEFYSSFEDKNIKQ